MELSEENEVLPLSKTNPVNGGCECVCMRGGGGLWVGDVTSTQLWS